MSVVLSAKRHHYAVTLHAERRLVGAGDKAISSPEPGALAAKELGVKDDRARLAIANAAVREGRKVGRWEVAAELAAAACKLDGCVSKPPATRQSPETRHGGRGNHR